MHAFFGFYIVHVFSLFVLIGVTSAAILGHQAEMRKKYLMWAGIASLGVFITGFGMAGIQSIGWPIWLWIKIACWLLISALAGLAYRTGHLEKKLLATQFVLVAVALTMIYLRPFVGTELEQERASIDDAEVGSTAQ